MKILLTGGSGQLGHALARSLAPLGELLAPARADFDLSRLDQVRAVLRAVRPDLIVNAAAYTAVDRAEAEPALAQRVNADAPALMASEARLLGAAMVQFSTDYVFDGSKQGAYLETDTPAPLNVYGRSKLAGEQAVAAAGIAHLILRSSWIYGRRGHNFLNTMLRLGSEKTELRVVADQFGAPTWCRDLAGATALVLSRAGAGGPAWWTRHGGLYHLSGAGRTSWCGFSERIMAQAGLACRIVPISSAAYAAAAPRPANSLLDNGKFAALWGALPAWESALARCLESAADEGVGP